MSTPAISIIIPHLNQNDSLRACLNSLKRQVFDLSKIEIIVVDNGSKLLPTASCAEFECVRLVQEFTPGPGPARNRGVAESRAPFLAFIDADCTADVEWVAAIDATLGRVGSIIGGDIRIALEHPERPTKIECYERVFAFRQEEYVTMKGFAATGNLAMSREAFDAVGLFAGIDRAEDRDWGRRASRMALVPRYVSKMIVYHPARRSFDELCEKWDRHISHDFEESSSGLLGKLRWLTLAAAVAASPLSEVCRIWTSRRVKSNRERWFATQILVKIRLYRAKVMLLTLLGARNIRPSQNWNRK